MKKVLLALTLTSDLWALPQDPTTVHGQVQIQNNGATFLQILQTTPQAIVNWNQFNIGLGETVRFLQPNQQAAILNRVTGVDPSLIQGMLQANGRVFLLNPNGILFGPNSVVDVGSFTASTLKMSNEDFLNGTYKLTQDGTLPLAALTNQGQIRVAEGGFVVLVSPLLDNQGMILAQSGHVNLGATTQATFSVDGRGLVQFTVPDGFDPQFTGGGQGGTVLLQPGQMSQLLHQVVSNPTLVEAGSFQAGANGQTLAHGAEGILLNSGTINTDGTGGTIRLDSSQASILPGGGVLSSNSQNGDGGDVRLLSAGRTLALGTITAAANGTGQGGFVEVSGKDLWLLGNVNVGSAQGLGGTILLDPTDITIIDGAGGTFDGGLPTPGNAGAGTVSVTAMQGQSAVNLNATNDVTYNGAGFNLAATALTIMAGNDIRLNTSGSITASSLSLNAQRDVIFNSSNSADLGATSGAFTMVAGRDATLSSQLHLGLVSPTKTSISAARDLTVTSLLNAGGSGFQTRLNAPRTDLGAGRNLTLNNSILTQSVAGNVTLTSGNTTSIQGSVGGSAIAVNLASLEVNAGQDFVANSTTGALQINASSGNLSLVAAENFIANSTGRTSFTAPNGSLLVRAGQVTVRGSGVNVTASSNTTLQATAGNLNVTAASGDNVTLGSSNGNLLLSAANDLTLAGDINVDLASAGCTTISATRDLTISSQLNAGASGFPTRLNGPRSDLSAGRNLTLNNSNLTQTIAGNVSLTSGNTTRIQNSVGGSGIAVNLASLQVNAGQDFVANSTTGALQINANTGNLSLIAAENFIANSTGQTFFTAPNGALLVRAGQVSVRGSGVNVTANSNATLQANSGNLSVTGFSGSNVTLASSNGNLLLSAAQDLTVAGDINVDFASAGCTTLSATRDLTISSQLNAGASGFPTRLNGPRSDLSAGRNLTLNNSNLTQTIAGNVTLTSGNTTRIQSSVGGSGIAVNLASLGVNAGQDFSVNASSGNFQLATTDSLNVQAGGKISFSAPGSRQISTQTGPLRLAGQTVDLLGSNLTSSQGNIILDATGNLTVDRLVTSPAANATLTGANIIINSMDRISGGNYTITTPGNLTELIPATNPPVLAALNITAGRAFNTNVNAANSSFSIPNVAPANLTVLVTAGNDSVFNSSASFQNFGGNVQPTFIPGQTGDIYVDGTLFYGGEPAPTPPPIPPVPVVVPVVAPAPIQQNLLTSEERSEILVQSNLALGNLGSFSRVLPEVERERLTVQQDSLNKTWALDPFSPTLALTLPGGAPLVYPSELRGLEALLRMSNPGDDPEEKIRGAYNTIVDQELREIWEIRYWRHLLEGFVIWEDRE